MRQAWWSLVVCIVLKFLVFDFIWCLQTTFTSFSYPIGYLHKIGIALVVALPFVIWRKPYFTWLLLFGLDAFLISNLLYFRTYSMAIPLDNYNLLGNLSDFTDSVFDAFRWIDLFFPLSTLWVIVWYVERYSGRIEIVSYRQRFLLIKRAVLLILLVWGSILLVFGIKGGFKKSYESLHSPSKHTCCTPIYTIFGTLTYEYMEELQNINTSETSLQIHKWMENRERLTPLKYRIDKRNRCIVILAESFESWVLERTVEGIEITPCLNALLREKTTLYAPYVLTQVRAGRSIDAQLLLYTGLLPVHRGVYSIKYPFMNYPSLVKALKEKYNMRSFCMTVDKKTTWNQNVIARSFGFDTLIYKKDFVLDELISYKERLSDGSFLRQCAEKIQAGKWLSDTAGVLIQCVTSTGHNPFILPEHLKQISFPNNIPQRMKDFMTVANYTDAAIGKFIGFLRTQPEYKDMIIVITGDHEGLADSRQRLANSKAGKRVVFKQPFVPFIVVNSPVPLRYEKVMGQIDIYPTLLQLLGLDDYKWTGMGQSILETDTRPFAVGPGGKIVGDTEGYSKKELNFYRRAWDISDLCIRYNYFNKL